MAIVIVLLSITMLVISVNSEKIPDMTVKTAQQQATLIKGNYDWKAFTQVLKQENYNYNFKSENTIIASPGETITVEVTEQVGTRRLFEVEDIYYVDKIGNRFITSSIPQENPIDSYSNRYMEQIILPDKEDTYYYYITLDYFEKGIVQYAFKVVVSSEPNYNIDELIKLKRTSILDYEGIQSIINTLPYSKNITNVMIRSSAKPTRLMIRYSEFMVERGQYKNNVVALFALVPELDIIEYSSPDDNYYFTRDEIEHAYGRSLEDYVENPELWQEEIFYKEKSVIDDTDLSSAVSKLIIDGLELQSGEPIEIMSIDENSFRELFKNKDSDVYIHKVYNTLVNYAKNVINVDYDTYKSQNHSEPFIMLSQINKIGFSSGDDMVVSGDLQIDNLHNIKILVIKDKKEIQKNYMIYSVNEVWTISEVY